jgi:MFS family permease
MWVKEQVSWPMVIYTMGPFLGPVIGPVVGGFINQHTSWRWTFYVLLIWAGVEVSPAMVKLTKVYHPLLCSGDIWSCCFEKEGAMAEEIGRISTL